MAELEINDALEGIETSSDAINAKNGLENNLIPGGVESTRKSVQKPNIAATAIRMTEKEK